MLSSLLTILFLTSASAHFVLQYPPSLGFDDDIEGTAPCGGFPVVFNNSDAQVQQGGFPISMLSTHPQAQWQFRATLSQQAPFNWTNLLPIVDETGLGQFCLPAITFPDEFVGQQGLIQVTQDAADGVLYQCAAVQFVSGTNSTVGSPCTNATGLTATLSNQNQFNASTTSATPSSASATATGSSTASASASPSASASASGDIALRVPTWVLLGMAVLGLLV